MKLLKSAIALLLVLPIVECSIGYDKPQCIAFDAFDSWQVQDRTRVTLFNEGRVAGTVEVVESMAGGSPLNLAHKIWFEARDDQLCGQRDVIVADGRRMHIAQVLPNRASNED